MRKSVALCGLLIVLIAGLPAAAQTPPDERLFQEAKILIFDKNWAEAQSKLDELLSSYPKSPWSGQARFYRAECLSEQKGREKEALEAYQDYLGLADRNASLAEEAEISIINVALALSRDRGGPYLREITERLSHPNTVVRYYAALQLSYVKDKAAASKAIPFLQDIVEREKDAELRDKAKIALLRISPDALKSVEDKRPRDASGWILKIRVWDKGSKNPELSISIPWALADLALGAIGDSEKSALRRKGYDLDKILDRLARSEETIFEVDTEDSVIKIWIEK